MLYRFLLVLTRGEDVISFKKNDKTLKELSMKDKKQISSILQKQIVDEKTKVVTGYVMISDSDFKNTDWISKWAFTSIVEGVGKTPMEYPLRKSKKGNEDENLKVVLGKALKVSMLDNTISMEVYTQKFGETWKLCHTHTLDKSLFDAYALVIKNDEVVSQAEKESKSPKNFSLNLG